MATLPRRRNTRTVWVGDVPIGGGHPISIQTMTKTDTRDVPATLTEIRAVARAGADLVRLAVPDSEAAAALSPICSESPIPVVADIHFDYRLAVSALDAGVSKIRLNPGNIGDPRQIREVLDRAGAENIPIRIGINAGSLPDAIQNQFGLTPEALVAAAEEQLEIMEAAGFKAVIVSLKASSVLLTVRANELMSTATDCPLHIGITEAGSPARGAIKSASGLGYLLGQGIGDTLRVSLTGDPVEEVRVAAAILSSWGLRRSGPDVISCPMCGRCRVDLMGIVEAVEHRLAKVEESIQVAVMGCEVNGPGEARHADVGLACGAGFGVLMYRGEIVKRVPESLMVEELMALVHQYLAEHREGSGPEGPTREEGGEDEDACAIE